MFTVSKKQLHELESTEEQKFCLHMLDFLKNEHAAKYATQTQEHWLAWIKREVREAHHFGILQEGHVAFYIDLHFRFAELDHHPKPHWAIHILTWPNREPERKLDLLEQHLEEAKQDSDAK